MAAKNDKKAKFKKIQDTEGSNFGNYQESTGGGKPFSTSNTRTTRENGKYRQANNKTNQPRTDDGKFTYKSVNGKSIDPKYGPSRGKTVNPLLTGGENGVKIEDVEQQFASKSGSYWDKYQGKFYVVGSEKIGGGRKDYRTHVAGKPIWDVAKQRYDEAKKEFGGEIEWDANARQWVATDKGGESEVFNEVKKGRPSKEESAAKQQAKKTGQEQTVMTTSGEQKLSPNASLLQAAYNQQSQAKKQYVPIFGGRTLATNVGTRPWKKKASASTSAPASTSVPAAQAPQGNVFVAPVSGGNAQAPTVNAAQNVGSIVNADYTPKYGDDDISAVKIILKEQGFSDDQIAQFDSLSPKEKDEYIDTYFE